MRPVNLIPPEERRGERSTTRTGPLVYVVVGVLGAILLGLALVVTTGNSISDRKAEREQLQAEKDALEAQSQALRHYADFAQLQQQREGTVVSLAHSRFDWERVMRELALVLPDDVWLVKMTGTVSSNVQVDDAAAVGIRSSVPGPALELVGCGADQDAVARFVASLHEIDGVTRVSVSKSARPDDVAAAAAPTGDSAAGSGSGDCRKTDASPMFEIVAAFDEAAPGATADPSAGAAGAAVAPTQFSSGLSEAQQQQAAATQATGDSAQQVQNAAQIVPGQ